MYRITKRQNAQFVVIRVIVYLECHEISFALIRVTGIILNKHIYIYIYIYKTQNAIVCAHLCKMLYHIMGI